MDYKDYKNARDGVWRLLIDQKICALPVRVSSVCKNIGVAVVPSSLENDDGYSMIVNGRPYIILNANCTNNRKRFTLAHELGHILLGHVGKYDLVNREPSPSDNPIEQAANVFASRLLAPACVLWGCGAKTPEQIADLCDISLQSAAFRAERITLLYKRQRFLTSPLERQVYVQFSDFIKTHQL